VGVDNHEWLSLVFPGTSTDCGYLSAVISSNTAAWQVNLSLRSQINSQHSKIEAKLLSYEPVFLSKRNMSLKWT